MSEPTQSFTLTEGQLTVLRYAIDRCFVEFLEDARDSTTPPGPFERAYVDAFMELCEIFGMDVPEVPPKP